VGKGGEKVTVNHLQNERTGLEIAIIGMAGKFPGANQLDQFWNNLKQGVESISHFTEDELIQAGVAPEQMNKNHYVKAKGYIEGVEQFDAAFFSYSPREAEMTDPQIRMVQETTWEALEGAGYDPQSYPGLIGLYVGASTNLNWMKLSPLMNSTSAAELSEAGTLCYKDAISTLTSYKLGLKGPSFTIYTACSTSLLSVHLACRALLTGECTIAAAGGVSVSYPTKRGYEYQEGMTLSPDGKVRAFDADASGAVFSDGVGMVILKRLEDALADGDSIHAIIKGSAANNDGGRKVGYTAPSVEGQADVIQAALNFAEVDAATIGYIETHGTATPLGDSIEFEALKRAFGEVDRRGSCAIGSVKSNIGHLDTAAGITGLIKAVLCLKHRQLPPTLHVHRPNPKLNAVDSPFYINTELTEWEREAHPLRAGVSAFGYGGTNVHLVLEEAPEAVGTPASRKQHVLTLSAYSETSLRQAASRYAQHLTAHPAVNIADAAYTMQTGRRAFPYRRAIVCHGVEDARLALERMSHPVQAANGTRELIFMLPSRSSAYREGWLTLYEEEPAFAQVIERNIALAQPFVQAPLKPALYEAPHRPHMEEMLYVLSLCSLIELLSELGAAPARCIGSGAAELAAAVCAGVLSLGEALRLVASRDQGLMMTSIQLQPASFAFFSAHTGAWIEKGQVTDSSYWAAQLQAEATAVGQWHKEQQSVHGELYVRLGPQEAADGDGMGMASVLDGFMETLASLWELGVPVAWGRLYTNERRIRIPLPTYAFEKQRYWLEPARHERLESSKEEAALAKRANMTDWFYSMDWEARPALPPSAARQPHCWLLLVDEGNVGATMAKRLRAAGQRVITVEQGSALARLGQDAYRMNAAEEAEYTRLLHSLQEDGNLPDRLLHLWNVSPHHLGADCLNSGFYSLIYLAKAIGELHWIHAIDVYVITNNMQKVAGENYIDPEKGTLLAPIKVIPQEYVTIRCKSIDFIFAPNGEAPIDQLIAELGSVEDTVVAIRDGVRYIRTFSSIPPEQLQQAVSLQADEAAPTLRQHGVYLITGGLGGVGLKLADYLARAVQAKLVLVSRSGLPGRAEWEPILQAGTDLALCERIGIVRQLESRGAEVLVVRADVADEEQMREALQLAEQRFGALHGVIHAAGVLRVKSAQCVIQGITRADCEEQFRPKMQGVQVLNKLLGEHSLDFCLFVSSLSPILGGLGFVAYAAANLYMDAFASQLNLQGNHRFVSVNWGDWQYTGKVAAKPLLGQSLEPLEMTPEEGVKTFQCVLGLSGHSQIVISSGDLHTRFSQWVQLGFRERGSKPAEAKESHTSTALYTIDELEQRMATIWMEFYRVDTVDRQANFFDLGATSLDIIQIQEKLVKQLQRHIPIGSMFEYPTIRSLAAHVGGSQAQKSERSAFGQRRQRSERSGDVAIIGMAGRFPGALTLADYWDNVANGVEAIRFFTDEELLESGVQPTEINNPAYVKAKGYLEGTDLFDAAFFDYTSRDAALMDPQLRLFHECAWTALEHAGYYAEAYPGLIGVFSGASPNLYWQVLSTLSESEEPAGQFLTSLLNDKDSLSTQISYKFNLRGPSTNVFTGCSTSLVAIHYAREALLNQQCDMAIAGGITITQPDKAGYVYQEGMLFSVDGHCRPFDEEASGMLFGDGVGIVVLKRLEEALHDGDTIHAILKGSAINNDGSRKIGYTAPSVDGQAEVIRLAQREARVEPQDISYIETHGTATKLGDTIEMKALCEVFELPDKQIIPIGSVKSNVGHLNAASGAAGLIKTVLAMQHQQLPPSLNVKVPNRQIGFEDSPFYVNTTLREWKTGKEPRRAGVSSFGIGGTNAHVILEEAPTRQPSSSSRPCHMLMLSAKTEAALDRMTSNLAQYMEQHPLLNVADLAFTLQTGRKPFKYRRALVCSSAEEGARLLGASERRKVHTGHVHSDRPKVCFLFSGNGAQYVNMGRELYEQEAVFREAMDACFAILSALTGFDYRAVLYPTDAASSQDEAKDKLENMEYCQPLILSFEYALAKLLSEWGIQPSAMIGYSFGEYAAACLAGVFTLEEALQLIVVRGRLMSSLPSGVMLSIPLPEQELLALLTAFQASEASVISLAIVNGPSCIVAGTEPAIRQLELYLKERRLMGVRVSIETAAHSHELDTILEPFLAHVRTMELRSPRLPFLSNITGTWITPEQATDAEYWVRHMRETVRFADGMQELLKDPNSLLIELGPGSELSALANRLVEQKSSRARIFHTVRSAHREVSDLSYLQYQIARMWTLGMELDWERFYAQERRQRIPLPTYSFEKVSHKLHGNPYQLGQRLQEKPQTGKKKEIADWFYVPQWMTVSSVAAVPGTQERWLLFTDRCGAGAALMTELLKLGHEVVIVEAGEVFEWRGGSHCIIAPDQPEDYAALLQGLASASALPTRIAHLWGVTDEQEHSATGPTLESTARIQQLGFYSLFHLAKALGRQELTGTLPIHVITNGVHSVAGTERLIPEKATVLGISLVITQEYPYLSCSCIDMEWPAGSPLQQRRRVQQLISECINTTDDNVIAYRGSHRFVLRYEPLPLAAADPELVPLRPEGVYVITGGLGGIGLVLAKHLAQAAQARLVLISRSGLPAREEWGQHLQDHTPLAAKIRAVRELEELGAQVAVIAADVADKQQLQAALCLAESRFGAIHGVIHGAGVLGGKTFNLLSELEQADCEVQFRAKLYGLIQLEEALRGRTLDFCLLMSSISAVLGGLGYAAYAASNNYMDAFVRHMNRSSAYPWLSVNWSDWKYWDEEDKDARIGASVHELSMTPQEGIESFLRALSWQQGDVLVHSPGDLQTRINQWVLLHSLREEEPSDEGRTYHARPQLYSDYASPRNETEERLAHIWQRIFNVEQVGIHDEFMELGGDSLKAITVVSRIHKEFHLEIPISLLFERSTIEKLAEYIQHTDRGGYGDIEAAEPKPYYRLSSAQQRFYILHRLYPESVAYNDTSIMLLEGEVDRQRLEAAFKSLIARHEIFRTTIVMRSDEPVQRVHEHADLHMEYFQACETEVMDMIARFIRPFDFEQAPYFRIGLIRLQEQRHVLMMDLHHIVTDGVSYDIFVHDLFAFYDGNSLPALRIQYKDYAEWQASELEQRTMRKHRQYWLDRFQGALPVLPLPHDYERPAIQSFEGGTVSFTLQAELTGQLRALIATSETTLFAVLLAVYTVLLSKYSGQEDIVVGTPITGRYHADLQPIIGVFVNMLAMRNSPAAAKTFRQYLAEVKHNSLLAFEHQKYPYEDLIAELGLQGQLDRNPLFDVSFIMQNMDTDHIELDKLKISPYPYDHKRAQFDLMLRTVESEDAIVLNMEYAAALFKRETVERLCERYVDILQQIVAFPDIRLRDICLKHQLKELQTVSQSGDFDDFDF